MDHALREIGDLEEAQRRMQKQINLFDKLPKTCSTCSMEFPKTREAHMSWKVVVRAKNEMVRLFCPACQEKAKTLGEAYQLFPVELVSESSTKQRCRHLNS